MPDARIIDREQWIRAASESMRVMTGGTDQPSNPITGRITGAQTGAVLAFVSSGILGQFDPFAVEGQGGQLLLVYPNVIAVERQLRVSPSDFRLWVCLHEVTHRVQFSANPWLAQHMSRALGVLTSDAGDDVAAVVARLADFVKKRRGQSKRDQDPNDAGILGFMRAVQSEPQRAAMDQLLVLGTLLEGHADHVMDAVGPAVVPSVQTIRHRFDQRRQRHQPPLQRLLRALLGLDAKMSQYTRGKAFVDHVVTRSAWTGSTPCGRAPTPCRCPTRSKIRSGGSTGCCSAAAGRPGRLRDGSPARRDGLVRGAVRRPGLAGADGGRGGDACRPPR